MYQFVIKRVVDIIVSIAALIFFSVLFLIVAVFIKIDDGGPVFYNAIRLGKDQKPFKMFKFRSMNVNAPDIRNSDGTTYNSSSDSRVTKVGRILRKTSIDELPQFLNVLIGNMSLIGPRPSPPGDKSQYPIEFFEKFKVKPGITGYNQALLRNSATMEERILNDSFYVNNINPILDLKIILLTIKGVVGAKNINRS